MNSFARMHRMLLGLCLLTCPYISGAPVEESLYKDVQDLVVELDVDTFEAGVFGRPHASILQFYSSWCGHCIDFAPKFTEFAKDIKGWWHTVRPLVINCADTRNTGVCRRYDVRGYPTLRYLQANAVKPEEPSKIGEEVAFKDRHSPASLKRALVTFLTPLYPFLQPLGEKEDVFADLPASVEEVVILEEGKDGVEARELMMDIGKHPRLRWRALPDTSAPLNATVARRGGGTVPLAAEGRTVPALVRGRLGLPPVVTVTDDAVLKKPEEEGVTKKQTEEAGLKKPTEEAVLKKPVDEAVMKKPGDEAVLKKPTVEVSTAVTADQVYHVDMENALVIALTQEVALHRVLTPPRLDALRAYVRTLHAYLPARPAIKAFLAALKDELKALGQSATYEHYQAALTRARAAAPLPAVQPWRGCEGSLPHLRGYTCGLWTSFHALTVGQLPYLARPGEVNEAVDVTATSPLEVTEAVHGFVAQFLSCRECSAHFQSMYSEDAERRGREGAAVWLWMAHNTVNKRIAGDASEDPKHPKIQWPKPAHCPKCWKESTSPGRSERSEDLAARVDSGGQIPDAGASGSGVRAPRRLRSLYVGSVDADGLEIRDARAASAGRAKRSAGRAERSAVAVPEFDRAEVLAYLGQVYGETAISLAGAAPLQGGEVGRGEMADRWGGAASGLTACLSLYGVTTLVLVLVLLLLMARRRRARKMFIETYKLP